MKGILIVDSSPRVSLLLAALACSRSVIECRPPPALEPLLVKFPEAEKYDPATLTDCLNVTNCNDSIPDTQPKTSCPPKEFGMSRRRQRRR